MLIEIQIISTILFLEYNVVKSATYYCDADNTVRITGESTGTIRTVVSGTSIYGNNLNCVWIIDGGVGKKIQLLVTGSNLEHAPQYTSCGGYDYLSIIDGDSIKSPEITSICGTRNPYEVITSGQYVYLRFSTNDKNFYQFSGVTLTFNIYNDGECPPEWTDLNTTDTCYRMNQNPAAGIDWYTAYQNCRFSGANLAIVDRHQIFDRLYGYAQSLSVSSAWIGLTDIESEGTLKWLNNQNLPSWIRTDGNIDDNDCAIFDFDYRKFFIKQCKNEKYTSVCQRDRVNATILFSLPEEKTETPTEVISLRWQIILGIGAGVVVIIVLFALYCKFRTTKPTVPVSENMINLTDTSNDSPRQHSENRPERRERSKNYNRSTTTSPTRYSDITGNTVQFNPQINVNVTVNNNGQIRDPPPSYSFQAHAA